MPRTPLRRGSIDPLLRRASRTLIAATLACATLASASASSLAAQRPADSALVRSLTFRGIGPTSMSGRVADVSIVEAPAVLRGGRLGTTMYVAVATGGIWKTTNGGITFAPVSDSIGVGSIGAVAAAPSDGNIVWVGSGEANNMRSSSWGIGVFKSTDGGKSWSRPMLPKTQHIGRIVIDPRDPNVVYVAAMGPLWAAGGERGLFKTTDGGKSWTNTKNISAQTGFTEVVIDPANPDVLYAASLQRERRAYGFLPGGTESAIWKTTDGAKTWTKLEKGLPTGELGRIGLSVCRSRPGTVYASVHASGAGNGLYRTDDAGANWRKVDASNGTAWYYSQVRCDPTDAEHVYRLNATSQESSDGGKTWVAFGVNGNVHGDAHALWIDPDDHDHIVLGNDGGLDISYDRGKTWYNVENIVGAQFYSISVDDQYPFYHVYGGLQDNQTWGGPNRTRTPFGPSNADWYRMAGGDGFYNVTDKFDNKIVYAESQSGGIVRYDTRTGQTKGIKPPARNGEKHRYNWSAPIVPSRYKAGTVYFAANHLFKSTNYGDSWTTISPDLTRDIDRDNLPLRGSVPPKTALGRHEGTAAFSNITAVSESPRRAGILAVGTDDGVVQVSRNDGGAWTRSTSFPGVPDTTYVSSVQLSKHAEGTVYASFDGHRSNDFTPYVYKSTDFGKTWTSITGNLPAGGAVQVIREHHREPNLLFVGTEFGAYYTIDGGTTWTPLHAGMPTVPIWDLQIQERWNDLVLGTHGRGIYILDDLSPLEHLAAAKRENSAYLFPVRNEIALVLNQSRNSGMGSTGWTGTNPDHGVHLAYLMPDTAGISKAKLEVIDAAGRIVRELPVPKRAGLFRPVWDMRVGAPLTAPMDTTLAGRGGGGGGGFGGGFGRGPATYTAVPGEYTARLTVTPVSGAPTVRTQRFALLRDPDQPMSVAQLKQLDDFRLEVVRFQKQVTDAQTQADSVIRRYAAAKKALDSAGTKATPVLKDSISALEKSLGAFVLQVGASAASRASLGAAARAPVDEDDDRGSTGAPDPSFSSRAGALNGAVNANFPVSSAQKQLLADLRKELGGHLAKLDAVKAAGLPRVVESLKAAGISVADVK